MIDRERALQTTVGLFVLAGIAALIILALKVSGINGTGWQETGYHVTATFDNIGGLKVRAPVKMAGVTIGRVDNISLDAKTFKASVNLWLSKQIPNIPEDSTAGIFTAGLLGANYIGITPGFSDNVLQEGSQITLTNPALILENLIGQFLLNKVDKGKEQ